MYAYDPYTYPYAQHAQAMAMPWPPPYGGGGMQYDPAGGAAAAMAGAVGSPPLPSFASYPPPYGLMLPG
jgi:hypothetical protein